MRASVKQYAPGHELVVAGPTGQLPNTADNFGDAYNHLLTAVFANDAQVIVANDDIVLTPTSVSLLLEDVEALRRTYPRVGFVGARSDCALPAQNIRFPSGRQDRISMLRWHSEAEVKEVQVVAPLFAWLSREAFQQAQFPPLNWYSDDVICLDLLYAGYRHFVSRSYVHHVGSQSVGQDAQALTAAARPWIEANRPHYAAQWLAGWLSRNS